MGALGQLPTIAIPPAWSFKGPVDSETFRTGFGSISANPDVGPAPTNGGCPTDIRLLDQSDNECQSFFSVTSHT